MHSINVRIHEFSRMHGLRCLIPGTLATEGQSEEFAFFLSHKSHDRAFPMLEGLPEKIAKLTMLSNR
jgi:hypothetical protein